MILLDRPYVSKHFLNYLERSGQPVLETPFTAGLARDYGLNLVDDAEAEKRCRNGERLYTSSENALEWIHAHLGDMPVARHIDAMKDKAALRRLLAGLARLHAAAGGHVPAIRPAELMRLPLLNEHLSFCIGDLFFD